MKKLAALALTLTLCFTTLTACAKTSNSPTGKSAPASAAVSSDNNEIITSGLDNLDLVTFIYVRPLCINVWNYSWNNVTEIKPDDLLYTCRDSDFYSKWEVAFENDIASAGLIEWNIQQHFAVDSNYLKTSQFYNSKDKTYQMVSPPEGETSAVALSAKQNGKQIVIEVGAYSNDREKATPLGLLTVEPYYGRQVVYVSYSAYQQEGDGPSKTINGIGNNDKTITSGLHDLNLVCNTYVEPLFTVWVYSWNDVSEIKADDLLNTCYFNDYIDYNRDYEGVYLEKTAPAPLIEWCIQQHFNVSSDYLRTSEYYNPQENTYNLVGGFGSGSTVVVLSAKKKGKQIIIELGLEGYVEKTFPLGLLTVEPLYGRQIKYVSYSVYDSALKQLSNGN